jgi:hypothetical protein
MVPSCLPFHDTFDSVREVMANWSADRLRLISRCLDTCRLSHTAREERKKGRTISDHQLYVMSVGAIRHSDVSLLVANESSLSSKKRGTTVKRKSGEFAGLLASLSVERAEQFNSPGMFNIEQLTACVLGVRSESTNPLAYLAVPYHGTSSARPLSFSPRITISNRMPSHAGQLK